MKTHTPLVSILIPAHNAQRWISSTVQSALAQTWPSKEIIIVDDGSSDETLTIARSLESRDVAVVSQQKQGASAARNTAYSIAQGDYIQWLDADDLLDPHKISHQMAVAIRCNSQRTLFSGAWGAFIYRVCKARFVPTALWCDLSPIEWLLRKLGQNLWMQTATWLTSRTLTDVAGRWDTRMLSDDDGEYFSRVILASDGIRFVPDARMYYRRGFPSLSYIGDCRRQLEALLLSLRLNIDYIRSLEDSQRVRAACREYLRTSLIYFYPEHPDLVDGVKELAAAIREPMQPPHLSWKYCWIQKLCGWHASKRAQMHYNQAKLFFLRSWDKTMFSLSSAR
ncbi:MAG TPA: glycosyltransferase family A protein [Chthoniobacterales bacterium]